MHRCSWCHMLFSRLHYLIAVTYRYFGNKYGMQWEYERAIDAFTRAIEHDPSFARAYLERGILYWREIDHPRRAILDLTKAYELNPALIEARFNRGVAHQQLREYDAAVADFKAYLEVGTHSYWREYAENMIRELDEWISKPDAGPLSS